MENDKYDVTQNTIEDPFIFWGEGERCFGGDGHCFARDNSFDRNRVFPTFTVCKSIRERYG